MRILRHRHVSYWLPALLGAGLLVMAGLLLLGPGGRDDTYKTLWPAEALAKTGSIVNYNGDAIEQSSSLLHVLLLGGLEAISGESIAELNLGFLIFCGLAGIFLSLWVARLVGIPLHWSMGMALGGHGLWAYWTMGGLDAVLAADCWLLFLGSFLVATNSGRWWLCLPTAVLLVLARPEHGLVAIGALGLSLGLQLVLKSPADERPERKQLLYAILVVATALAALIAWRIWHGGYWLPQSARAKTDGFSWEKARHGLGYLWLETYRHLELIPLWLGLLLGCGRMVLRRQASLGGSLLLSIILVGLTFVVMSGGDWMENGRFIVPMLPLLTLNFYLEMGQIVEKWRLPIQIGYLAACIGGLLWVAMHFNLGYSPLHSPNPNRIPAQLSFAERNNKVHLRDAYPLAALLQEHDRIYQRKGAKVNILSQQAGFMLYHLAHRRFGEFRFVDLVGLCTSDFTECSVTQGRGRMRGGLNMDLVYLFDDLERIQKECGFARPDIVFGLDDATMQLGKSLEQHGYEIVAWQMGDMPSGGSLFPGMQVEAYEFVAIDTVWSAGEGMSTVSFDR